MLQLYVVRHGITVWNQEGRVQGHTDVPLSAEGVEQAKRLAARLANEQIDAVWSSDLARARATAEEIAAIHSLPVQTTAALRENGLGEWEGLTENEILARGDEAIWRAFRRDPGTHRPPGSEPMEAVWDRMLGVLVQIREAHARGGAVVVGHGGSLRVLLCDALQAPRSSMHRFTLENASLSLIEYTEHRTWLRIVNDTSHLRVPTEPV